MTLTAQSFKGLGRTALFGSQRTLISKAAGRGIDDLVDFLRDVMDIQYVG